MHAGKHRDSALSRAPPSSNHLAILLANVHGVGFRQAAAVSPRLVRRAYAVATFPVSSTNDWHGCVHVCLTLQLTCERSVTVAAIGRNH